MAIVLMMKAGENNFEKNHSYTEGGNKIDNNNLNKNDLDINVYYI